jgi:hypothetical protein
LVVFFGLAAGLALRATWHATQNRAEAAAAMFEHWCVSRLNGKNPVPGPPLIPIEQERGNIIWVDPASRIGLEINDVDCSINDRLAPLTRSELKAFRRIVPTRMADWAPALDQQHAGAFRQSTLITWYADGPRIKPWVITLMIAGGREPPHYNWLSLSMAKADS